MKNLPWLRKVMRKSQKRRKRRTRIRPGKDQPAEKDKGKDKKQSASKVAGNDKKSDDKDKENRRTSR